MGAILIHIVLSVCIGFLMQLILHEIGHMIFGHVTGWKFLFIQVHRFAFKFTGKKFKFIAAGDKNYRCIMYPENINSNALLYTMGGCILNLVSAIIGFFIMGIARKNPVLWIYIWSFSAFGAGFLLMNGTARIKRVCNDKACYDLLKGDFHTGLCHNAQLITAKYLANGLTYRQIGDELICLCPDAANNDIEAYQAVLEYYYYLDICNYCRAGQALKKIKIRDNISKEITDIVHLEKIYIKLVLILKNQSHDFNMNYKTTCDIKRCCKKGDVHSLRVMEALKAFEAYKAGHINNAIDIINKAIMSIDKSKYVYEGEKVFCIRKLEDMKKDLVKILQNMVRYI